MNSPSGYTLISATAGGIGQALLRQQLQRGPVISLSRQPQPSLEYQPEHPWQHIQIDLSDPRCVTPLSQTLEPYRIEQVFACTGILHSEQQQPEKSLRSLDRDWLLHSIDINVLTHVHLAQALDSKVSASRPLRWMSLSAKVGSIEDNGLGGWYSYRMSKAALNMLIKNLAIEWGRKSPISIVTAVHPGTTDTQLSMPFQRNIPAQRLYSPKQTAQRLTALMAQLSVHQHGKLLFWDGSPLPW